MPHERLLVGSFLAVIEVIQVSARCSPIRPDQMADDMIDLLPDGLRPRYRSDSS